VALRRVVSNADGEDGEDGVAGDEAAVAATDAAVGSVVPSGLATVAGASVRITKGLEPTVVISEMESKTWESQENEKHVRLCDGGEQRHARVSHMERCGRMCIHHTSPTREVEPANEATLFVVDKSVPTAEAKSINNCVTPDQNAHRHTATTKNMEQQR
jgi:hypothetical protein